MTRVSERYRISYREHPGLYLETYSGDAQNSSTIGLKTISPSAEI